MSPRVHAEHDRRRVRAAHRKQEVPEKRRAPDAKPLRRTSQSEHVLVDIGVDRLDGDETTVRRSMRGAGSAGWGTTRHHRIGGEQDSDALHRSSKPGDVEDVAFDDPQAGRRLDLLRVRRGWPDAGGVLGQRADHPGTGLPCPSDGQDRHPRTPTPMSGGRRCESVCGSPPMNAAVEVRGPSVIESASGVVRTATVATRSPAAADRGTARRRTRASAYLAESSSPTCGAGVKSGLTRFTAIPCGPKRRVRSGTGLKRPDQAAKRSTWSAKLAEMAAEPVSTMRLLTGFAHQRRGLHDREGSREVQVDSLAKTGGCRLVGQPGGEGTGDVDQVVAAFVPPPRRQLTHPWRDPSRRTHEPLS